MVFAEAKPAVSPNMQLTLFPEGLKEENGSLFISIRHLICAKCKRSQCKR